MRLSSFLLAAIAWFGKPAWVTGQCSCGDLGDCGLAGILARSEDEEVCHQQCEYLLGDCKQQVQECRTPQLKLATAEATSDLFRCALRNGGYPACTGDFYQTERRVKRGGGKGGRGGGHRGRDRSAYRGGASSGYRGRGYSGDGGGDGRGWEYSGRRSSRWGSSGGRGGGKRGYGGHSMRRGPEPPPKHGRGNFISSRGGSYPEYIKTIDRMSPGSQLRRRVTSSPWATWEPATWAPATWAPVTASPNGMPEDYRNYQLCSGRCLGDRGRSLDAVTQKCSQSLGCSIAIDWRRAGPEVCRRDQTMCHCVMQKLGRSVSLCNNL